VGIEDAEDLIADLQQALDYTAEKVGISAKS
jgi:cystathionine beta-lyase/cystathionine gamma-synthase